MLSLCLKTFDRKLRKNDSLSQSSIFLRKRHMSKIVHQWRLFCYPDTLNSNQREFKSPNGWLENAKPLMVVTVWISSIFKANFRPVILNQLCQLWLNWTKPKRLDWSMVKFCFIRLIFRELFFLPFFLCSSEWLARSRASCQLCLDLGSRMVRWSYRSFSNNVLLGRLVLGSDSGHIHCFLWTLFDFGGLCGT